MDEKLLETFERDGVVAIPAFLSAQQCGAIIHFMDGQESMGVFRDAAIGKGSGEAVNKSQRGDKISWVDGSECPELTRFQEEMDAIRIEFNRNFYLGIDHFEFHLTRYPPGTFYKRHSDRHQTGSPRVVSFVLYLNPGWEPADGGELVIYRENVAPLYIEPRLGTLAMFLSEIEHEVLTTNKTRSSITGWMRQMTR
ncbi:MAG: 2OG-Fe(II) oxygenase [Flavobacteriales bacterium]|nr:2OG-Fe(II) oxygenase [Flavobacteriales bacterium]